LETDTSVFTNICTNIYGVKILLKDLMFIPCISDVLEEKTNNPAHRPRNHTLYDIPTLSLYFQVTQEDPISSLMMVGYCRNM
jgi:hypothetical protein